MAPPRKSGKSATSRKSQAKPADEGTTPQRSTVEVEPGVSLPAPKPPADAAEAAKQAAAESAEQAATGSADDAKQAAASDASAAADEARHPEGEPGGEGQDEPSPQSYDEVIRDGVHVPAEDKPPKGYARGKVAIAKHLYYVDDDGRRRHHKASIGAVLELPVEEIERGLKIEALVDPDTVLPTVSTNPLELDDEGLAEWVSAHPIDEVVALATSVEAANRLLEAERAVHTDPRVEVLRGIEAVLNSGRV